MKILQKKRHEKNTRAKSGKNMRNFFPLNFTKKQ